MNQLTQEDRNRLINGQWLQGDLMNVFGHLLAAHSESEYRMQETWKVQWPHYITEEPYNKKYIQILHSCEDFLMNTGGHWVCAYYDRHSIFIYDSLNRKKLHRHHKVYLQRLFPSYPFDQRPVKFPTVTGQLNSDDCGVFAIAFAVTLLFGLEPQSIQYDHRQMRQHLLAIFDSGIISHFPRIVQPGDAIKILSLKQLKARRIKAMKMIKVRSTAKQARESDEKKALQSSVEDGCKKNGTHAISKIGGGVFSKTRGPLPLSASKFTIPAEDDSGTSKKAPRIQDTSAMKIANNPLIQSGTEDPLNTLLHEEHSLEDPLMEEHFGKKPLCLQYSISKFSDSMSSIVPVDFTSWKVVTNSRKNTLIKKNNSSTKSLSFHNPVNAVPLEPICTTIRDSRTIMKNRKCDVKPLIYDAVRNQNVPVENKQKPKKFNPMNNDKIKSISPKTAVKACEQEMVRRELIDHTKSQNVAVGNRKETEKLISKNKVEVKLTPVQITESPYKDLKKKGPISSRTRGYNEMVVKQSVKDLQANSQKRWLRSKKNNITSSLNIRQEGSPIETIHSIVIMENKIEAAHSSQQQLGLQQCLSTERPRPAASIDIHDHSQSQKGIRISLASYSTESYPIKEQNNKRKRPADNVETNPTKRFRSSANDSRKMKRNEITSKSKQSIHVRQKIRKAKEISRKYYRISVAANDIKTLFTKERYITNLAKVLKEGSNAKSRLEAERIIKWCFHIRDKKIFDMRRQLQSMKDKVELCFTQLSTLDNVNIEDKIKILCGILKEHTPSSEPYFAETAYIQPLNFPKPIKVNMEGKAVNILSLIKTKQNKLTKTSWNCSQLCRAPDDQIMEAYEKFMHAIRTCTLRKVKTVFSNIHKCTVKQIVHKLGHSQACYISPFVCKSLFLSVEFLSPHFHDVRTMKNLFYCVLALERKISNIDTALNSVSVPELQEFAAQAKGSAKTFESTDDILLDEDAIIKENHEAFEVYKKRSMDVPRLVCISCDKLCYARDIRKIENLRSLPTGGLWHDLINHLQAQSIDCDYICQYCLTKFRSGNMPPTSILNKLAVKAVPDVISRLNDYEKILIQRAKAFQTIIKIGTVAKKNMPHRAMVSKVQGRCFHLPLPIEETLRKICPVTAPINLSHELYILVRGIPTKSKRVWETLVDVKKVFDALLWLKDNNPLYSAIELPTSPAILLDAKLCDVEFEIPQECSSDDDAENEDGTEVVAPEIEIDNINPEVAIIKDGGKQKIALLTQMTQSDVYYEQFTIHPMYAGKVDKTATELYQMLKVQDVLLDNRDKSLDLKCFPDLYPYGVNGEHDERSTHLTAFEYIKTRLLSKHSQFRLNQQYLFHLLNEHNLRQLSSGIFHKMNVTNARVKYTAGSYLEQLAKGELEGHLNTIFSKLRNTEQFWRKPRNDLNCMIYHYGPPTWFLTLSPGEWCWAPLGEYLQEINPHMAGKSISELVAADPVSTSRFIDNEFRAIIDFICSKSNPIGEVTHYFWRREYQSRGIQHFHSLIWIQDAPVLGISSKEEVVEFLRKYVTSRIPNKSTSPTLHRRIMAHQCHRHNSYCLRTKSVGKKHQANVKTHSICRFSFPKPVTNDWIIRDVETSIAGRRQLKKKCQLYDNPRAPDEVFINNYNPALLTVWEGNMDISFVGEKSAALARYITKYILKAEKTHEDKSFDQINSTKSLHSRLWNIGLRTLSNRELSALEAADTLLGNSLYGTDPDTTIKWIDVNMIRSRKLKPRRVLQAMDKHSTDIFYGGLVDHFYPNRPVELNGISLYDYAMWYDVVKVKPTRKEVEYYSLEKGLYLRKRTRGYLINHYKCDMKTTPESYFYSLLLLFQPWRDVDELKNGHETYTESFLSVQMILPAAIEYHECLIEAKYNRDEITELVQKKLDEMETQGSDEINTDVDPLGCNPIEANEIMKDFRDIGVKQENKEINVTEMIKELNSDQKRIFDRITDSINASKILRLYVSGEGGTGKSFLIKTISCWLKQTIGKDTAVTAPTGIAAFNVDGLTVHRLFQLPVEHGQTPKYRELSDVVLKAIRDQLRNVALIVIDEVSMISNITLMYIHLRLTEIFNTSDVEDGWFGKKHILLFGDLLQLPPVREEPAFFKLSQSKVTKLLGSLGSIDLWCNLFSYDELTINMRQKNDSSYREMLSRIRLGFVSSSDITVLETRKVPLISTDFNERICGLCDYINSLPPDAVCLLPTCHMCDVLNDAMLSKISTKEIKLVADDILDCAPSLRKKTIKILDRDAEDTSHTAGLARSITVKIGAKIMLRRNIDVTIGLVNGTIGTIVSVSQSLDNSGIEKVKIRLSTGAEYDIERVSVKFQVMDGAFVIRKQFPLCLSYGITIHKSQGLSLNHVVIDAGNCIFSCGQVYVALSRVTSLNGLHLINFDPHSVRANPQCVTEYNRLRQLYRPDLAAIQVSNKRGCKITDVVWALPRDTIESQKQKDIEPFMRNNHVVGFQNLDGVSCYANTIIQCIFHCKPIKELLMKRRDQEPLSILFREYMKINHSPTTVMIVRQHIGGPFVQAAQQDVSDFFMALCDNTMYVRDAVEHKLLTKTWCQSCGYTTVSKEQSNYILILNVPNSKKIHTLQEIIDHNLLKWCRNDGHCNNCSTISIDIQHNVTTAQKTLVVQLAIMAVDQKTGECIKLNCSIKAIPSSKVMVFGRAYKVSSAIYHHGQTIRDGHYTCMIRDGTSAWIHVDDCRTEQKSWPRNGKDGYLFFLERV